MRRFIGKVALVTGASRGIGRAIAEAFVNEGAWVALCARSSEVLTEMARAINQSDGRALALSCDVTCKADVDAAIEQLSHTWGKLQIIVNNAGLSRRTPMDESSEESWHAILNTNLTGAYRVSKAGLDLMHGGWGRIINLSSVLGRFGAAGYSAYCASKHGLIGLTRALAAELAPRGITVNAICPGWVSTQMAEEGIRESAAAQGISPEEARDRALEEVPLRRFIDPEEVARLALYLASEDAAGITGQAYNLCGGESMD